MLSVINKLEVSVLKKQKQLLSFVFLGVKGNWARHPSALDPLRGRQIKDRVLMPAIVFPPILQPSSFSFLFFHPFF
jgi:hypothetical protein